MDACRKIWFYTPLQYVGMFLSIMGMGAGMMALLLIC
jgi:hypothetical protein